MLLTANSQYSMNYEIYATLRHQRPYVATYFLLNATVFNPLHTLKHNELRLHKHKLLQDTQPTFSRR